jgi:amidase
MSELWELTGTEIVDLVKSAKVSAVDVCKSTLARLEAINPAINAVVQRTDAEALGSAQAIDDARARGDNPGAMAGVPVVIKVNVDQAGYATTNGLRTQADLVATEDSPVVANLKRAGAIIVGRTNTPAFSLRWFTRNSLHGHTRNPVNPALTPGGSSGGTAAAVASGIGAIGHGTDIGGSIRYPAYACGIQGIRPTLGRIPAVNFTSADRHIGAQLMAVSGPLARSVADLRLGLEAMSAKDLRDPWWTPTPLSSVDAPKRAALTIAPEGLAVQPAVENALREAAARLTDAGWEVVETECPPFREPARLQLLLWLAEMSHGGGQAIANEADPDASLIFSFMEKLCPPPELNDFMTALQRRVGLLREWSMFLDKYPVLICPVSAETPFADQLDVSSSEAFARVFEAQLTQIGLPLMGLPGLAVFTGMASESPCGAQLIGGRYQEDVLLKAAADIEARGSRIAIANPGSPVSAPD